MVIFQLVKVVIRDDWRCGGVLHSLFHPASECILSKFWQTCWIPTNRSTLIVRKFLVHAFPGGWLPMNTEDDKSMFVKVSPNHRMKLLVDFGGLLIFSYYFLLLILVPFNFEKVHAVFNLCTYVYIWPHSELAPGNLVILASCIRKPDFKRSDGLFVFLPLSHAVRTLAVLWMITSPAQPLLQDLHDLVRFSCSISSKRCHHMQSTGLSSDP